MLWAAACSVQKPAATYADPTAATEAPDKGLTVALKSPDPQQAQSEPVVELVIAASGPDAIARVEVSVAGGPRIRASSAGNGTWRLAVGLLPGGNSVVLHATDIKGQTRQAGVSLRYFGGKPSVRLSKPTTNAAVPSKGFEVAGHALAAAGGAKVAGIDLAALDGTFRAADLKADGGLVAFSGTVDPLGKPGFRVRVRDDKGGETERTIAVRFDDKAPTITIEAPATGASVGTSLVKISGKAADDDELARVDVRVGSGAWIRADGTTDWSLDAALQQGPNTVTARATDAAGNTATAAIHIDRRRTIDLLAKALHGPGGELKLTLTKAQLKALLPADKARELIIYYLDLRPVLLEAIAAINPRGG